MMPSVVSRWSLNGRPAFPEELGINGAMNSHWASDKTEQREDTPKLCQTRQRQIRRHALGRKGHDSQGEQTGGADFAVIQIDPQ